MGKLKLQKLLTTAGLTGHILLGTPMTFTAKERPAGLPMLVRQHIVDAGYHGDAPRCVRI